MASLEILWQSAFHSSAYLAAIRRPRTQPSIQLAGSSKWVPEIWKWFISCPLGCSAYTSHISVPFDQRSQFTAETRAWERIDTLFKKRLNPVDRTVVKTLVFWCHRPLPSFQRHVVVHQIDLPVRGRQHKYANLDWRLKTAKVLDEYYHRPTKVWVDYFTQCEIQGGVAADRNWCHWVLAQIKVCLIDKHWWGLVVIICCRNS